MRSGDSKRRIKARTFASTYLNPMPTRKRIVSRVAVIPRASIFGRYKIHFWNERHGLFPFLDSLGVSSVILLAINYAVLSPNIPGLFPSLSLRLLSPPRNLPASRISFGTIPDGTPERHIAENFHRRMSSQLTYLPLSAFGRWEIAHWNFNSYIHARSFPNT